MRISRTTAFAAGALLLLAAGGAAWLYAQSAPFAKADAGAALRPLATGAMAKLQVVADPAPAPDYAFIAPDGGPATLRDFRGRVAVVNVWAMWCAPCREEMPTLAALARTRPSGDVAVVTVDVDHEPAQVVAAKAFLADKTPLPFYRDPKFQLPFELPGKGGMPQTVLLDRQGRVRAHLTGAADWSSPEARAVVDALLAEPDPA